MTKFEKEIDKAERLGLKVIEGFSFDCPNVKGLIIGDVVFLSKSLETANEKSCVLSEEIAHYQTNTGNISDQDNPNNRRQELKAHRRMIHDKLPLERIVKAVARLGQDTNSYELSETLCVTEEFLEEAITIYWRELGDCVEVNGYLVRLRPFGLIGKREEHSEWE